MVLPLLRRLNYTLNQLSPCITRNLASQVISDGNVKPTVLAKTADTLAISYSKFEYMSPLTNFCSLDIVLEDKIVNKVIKGLAAYKLHTLKYMIYINWRYNGFGIKAVEVNQNEKDQSIEVKWQIWGRPGWYAQFMFDFIRHPVKALTQEKDDWEAMEGVSIYYLNDEGKINKHLLKPLAKGKYKDIIKPNETNPLLKPEPSAISSNSVPNPGS